MQKDDHMSKYINKKIIQIDEHLVQSKLTEIVKGTVEETLNSLLDAPSVKTDEGVKAMNYFNNKLKPLDFIYDRYFSQSCPNSQENLCLQGFITFTIINNELF